MMILGVAYNTITTIIRILEIAAMVSIFMSWIMPMSRAKMTIDYLLSPLMRPCRWLNMKIAARTRIPLDFSYLFFLIGLDVVRALVYRLYIYLIYMLV